MSTTQCRRLIQPTRAISNMATISLLTTVGLYTMRLACLNQPVRTKGTTGITGTTLPYLSITNSIPIRC